jgi:hypothetical protein
MSSKNNTWENSLLLLVFNNTDATGIGDAGGLRGSVTAGSLFVSLHTADPGEAGVQNTSEMTLGSYARIGVARSGAGWTVATNNASNTAVVRFPSSGSFTSGSETAKFFQIGVSSSGATAVLYTGHLGDIALAFTAEASTDLLTVKGHTLVDNDEVFVFDVPGQPLPTGLARGLYFVITPTGDDFQVETTLGGGAVNFTVDGGGYIAKLTPKLLTVGDALTFEIGDLDVFED